jgi:hypothetical protein
MAKMSELILAEKSSFLLQKDRLFPLKLPPGSLENSE